MKISDKANESLNEIINEFEGDLSAVRDEYWNQGICLACGDLAESVEPDATGYECDSCGRSRVTGMENALLLWSLAT